MGYFPTETYTVGSSFALLWVLYPMTILVGIELFLRAMSNDDDDDQKFYPGESGLVVANALHDNSSYIS